MNSPRPYSRHSPDELDTARNAIAAPMLADHHRQRIAAQSSAVCTLLDNVRARCGEVSDMLDEVSIGDAGGRVEFRGLLETLKECEVNLEAAVGKLAGELGLVAL
jgi:hypothetical protein